MPRQQTFHKISLTADVLICGLVQEVPVTYQSQQYVVLKTRVRKNTPRNLIACNLDSLKAFD